MDVRDRAAKLGDEGGVALGTMYVVGDILPGMGHVLRGEDFGHHRHIAFVPGFFGEAAINLTYYGLSSGGSVTTPAPGTSSNPIVLRTLADLRNFA